MSTSDAGAPEPVRPAGQLTVYLGENVVHEFRLTMPRLTVGRAPDNDLPLPDPKVSSRHAELRQTPEGTVLTDLGSTNGTLVDGIRIPAHQPHLLPAGAVFFIGSYGCVYSAAEAAVQPRDEAASLAAAAAGPVESPVARETAEAREAAETPAAVPALPVHAIAPSTPAELEAAQVRVSLPSPVAPPPARSTWDPPMPAGPLSGYLRYLPTIFQDADFLGRFLLIFETIWEPLEQRQDHVEMYFDARTCPESFLPWLASWLDPVAETPWPEARLRAIVPKAMDLYRWRGTRYGLAQTIELATGFAPRIAEDPERPYCFRVVLEVPSPDAVDRRLLERLIEAHKPAHAGYVLEVAARA